MRKTKITFWNDGDFFIGFLNDYPDYETQAYSKEELLENLRSLLKDIETGEIPFIRKVEELANSIMKRRELIKQPEELGCVFVRHGGNHDWYSNPKTKTFQPIPRHN